MNDEHESSEKESQSNVYSTLVIVLISFLYLILFVKIMFF